MIFIIRLVGLFFSLRLLLSTIEKDEKKNSRLRMCLEFDDENSFLMMDVEKKKKKERIAIFCFFCPFFCTS